MIRLATIGMAALAAWFAGAVGERTSHSPAPVRVGVVVEETTGASAATRSAARARVARLRARGVPAELRLARSPSEALASAATLATRGAGRLVLIGADHSAVIAPLRERRPDVRLEVVP